MLNHTSKLSANKPHFSGMAANSDLMFLHGKRESVVISDRKFNRILNTTLYLGTAQNTPLLVVEREV